MTLVGTARRGAPALAPAAGNMLWLFLISQKSCAPQGCQKILFDVGKLFSHDGVPGHQDQLNGPCEIVLMQPETFAKQPSGARAHHRTPDFSAGHDAQFRTGALGEHIPVRHQAAQGKAFPLLSNADEIPVLCDPRTPGQPQTFRSGHGRANQTGVRRLRPWRRRLARIARPLLLELRFRNPC
jgi:hypothetical protein